MGIFSPSFLPTFMERHEKRPQTFVIIFVVGVFKMPLSDELRKGGGIATAIISLK